MPKTALFVIDIQHELARDPKTEIPHASRICDAGHLLLARARSAIDAKRGDGLPVDMSIVFVQHEENEANGTLVRGSSAWELIFQPRLGDGHEMLVAKSTGDAFESNPDLAGRLRSQGVEKIVAFGIQSECCVLATSKGALDAGFELLLLSGAHSTYDSKSKSAVQIERDVEKDILERGGKAIPWEEWTP